MAEKKLVSQDSWVKRVRGLGLAIHFYLSPGNRLPVRSIRQEMCPGCPFVKDCKLMGPTEDSHYVADFFNKRWWSIISQRKLQKRANCISKQ